MAEQNQKKQINIELSDEMAADKKAVLFTQNFDISYEGLTSPALDVIEFKTDTDERIVMTFTSLAGEEIELPLWRANGNADGSLGNDEGNLWTNETHAGGVGEIAKDDYFILADGSKINSKRSTYVLQYKGYDKDSKEIEFENLGSGSTVKYTLNTANTVDILINGDTFEVNMSASQAALDDSDIYVDLNGNGLLENTTMNITTESGAWIQLPGKTGETGLDDEDVVVHIPTDLMDDDAPTESTTVPLRVDSDTEVYVETDETELQIGSSDDYKVYTRYGTLVEVTKPTSSPDTLKLSIPKTQIYGQVFVTSGAVQSTAPSSDGDTSSGVYTIPRVAVGAARLDTEASGYASQNVIVIGGPCANSVAAGLLGNPSPCGEGFEPNKAKIKLFEQTGGKVAMLVAGYSADDTVRASKVVANFGDYPGFSGMEVEVSGTSMSDVTVGAPSTE